MTNEPMRIAALLRDSRGQSWVETVVMLPVIVALLLGLFYLHDLVTTRIRAIEAARLVAWDSIWYGREDLFERKMLPELLEGAPLVDQALIEKAWKLRLQLVGLGFGLKHVDVFRSGGPLRAQDASGAAGRSSSGGPGAHREGVEASPATRGARLRSQARRRVQA